VQKVKYPYLYLLIRDHPPSQKTKHIIILTIIITNRYGADGKNNAAHEAPNGTCEQVISISAQ